MLIKGDFFNNDSNNGKKENIVDMTKIGCDSLLIYVNMKPLNSMIDYILNEKKELN